MTNCTLILQTLNGNPSVISRTEVEIDLDVDHPLKITRQLSKLSEGFNKGHSNYDVFGIVESGLIYSTTCHGRS